MSGHSPLDTVAIVTPRQLVELATTLAAPTLFAFDIDGVLAPLVARPEDSALAPGVLEALTMLAERTPVAIVSGRALDAIESFTLPPSILVAGSHGAERRGLPLVPLDDLEDERLARLTALAETSAAEAGYGAWVERKPTGVVLHVRNADPELGAQACEALAVRAERVAGAHVKRGHMVVDIAARAASKALAVAQIRAEVEAAAVCYLGDDVTDEDVFEDLDPAVDLAVRVGPGATVATHRLPSDADAAHFVRLLAL